MKKTDKIHTSENYSKGWKAASKIRDAFEKDSKVRNSYLYLYKDILAPLNQ